MTTSRNLNRLLLLLFVLLLSFRAYSQDSAVAGKWEGKLKVQGTELRIFFQIEGKAPSELRARMASPDQGANNIPVETVSWRNDSLILDVKVVGGILSASMSADKQSLNGIWKQAGASFPLNLKRTQTLDFYGNNKRPQEPIKPYPYIEEEVQYKNEADGVTLDGTLTLPQGKGPFPAVLLISGSGPQNRDEEIMGHKPFLILADYLTRMGIVVLRVDDRGVGKSTGNPETATTADNASDILAGFKYLQNRRELIKNKIGLIGHSEGGMIAPMVASNTNDVSFIVLLAGVGLPGDQLHRRQSEDIMRMGNLREEELNQALALNDKLYAVIKTEYGNASIEEKLKEVILQNSPLEGMAATTMAKQLSSPWFRYFINFDPVPYLRRVKCPVLAINGSKDVQVAAEANLKAIKKAIREGGNEKIMIKEIPGLNHLFQTAETGSMNEYVKIEETFSPIALKVIGDWIDGVLKLYREKS